MSDTAPSKNNDWTAYADFHREKFVFPEEAWSAASKPTKSAAKITTAVPKASRKGCAILYVQTHDLSATQKDMLDKILVSVGLNFAETPVYNCSTDDVDHILAQTADYAKVICFGLNDSTKQALQSQPGAPELVSTLPLAALAENRDAKMQLWQALKATFKLN